MARGKPAGLGEEAAEYKLVREEHPLPGKRQELVKKFSDLLNAGGVQRLFIEIGKPILVDRFVKAVAGEKVEDIDVLEELPMPTLSDMMLDMSRNAEIKNHETKSKHPLEVLLQVFEDIDDRDLTVRCLLFSSSKAFSEWLSKVPGAPKSSHIFGTRVLFHQDIPEDVALALAVESGNPDEVVYSVRFELR